MRTTTFTFRYWDQYETTQQSFDVVVLTPLSEPPFTPRLDVIRMFTSTFTVFPSTTHVFDILTTYLFETFASIPPRLDHDGNPIHFTFRGVHFDTLFHSPANSHRIGDTYRVSIVFMQGLDDPDNDWMLMTDFVDPNVRLNDDIIYAEPPVFILDSHESGPLIYTRYRHFLSVPVIAPPPQLRCIPPAYLIDGVVNWDTTHITCVSYAFAQSDIIELSPLVSWNTSNVTNMVGAFAGCEVITDLSPLASWNTSNVVIMSYMFDGCRELEEVSPLAKWNVSNVTNMNGMFKGCSSLIDVSALREWACLMCDCQRE